MISAIAKQLQSVYEAQEQLIVMRWLSNAVGKQLDGIGDIVVLSRSDAAKLELGKANANEIDDEVYRKYLYYKMFLNTSTGTRREIMKSLRFFWNEAPLYYTEDPKFPATIFVDTPELAPDVPIEGLLEAPVVKPAGVRFIVRVHTKTQNDEYKIRLRGLSNSKTTHTQVDEIPHMADVSLFKLSVVGLSVIKSTKTRVPEIPHKADIAQFRLRDVGLSVIKITKTEVFESERREVVRQFDLRVIGLSGIKRTTTQVSEVVPTSVSKSLRTMVAPLWQISRTDTGDYTALGGNTQRYNGLGTVKITNTPLAAYGGE